jgi:rhamnopyranosyl-N-acetylglucosaminyl-diphospho-decaprenol beta-1,3/1,4-galactofuranosyltransferase
VASEAVARGEPRVTAVVVTYNRRDLLLEALAAVHAQSRAADAVIVVDNASADGTAAAVRSQFPGVHLAELTRNWGGAGGFAYGISLALGGVVGSGPAERGVVGSGPAERGVVGSGPAERGVAGPGLAEPGGADLLWLMDDDTVPEPGALRALLAARDAYPGRQPALIASRVVWTDGRAHPMNTPRVKPFVSNGERAAAAAAGGTPIRSASFVSILVDAAECQRRGLPQADYFLWNDDFEFTTRLLRGNVGMLCPASVAVHKTATFGATNVDPGQRFFYEVRNKIWMLRTRAPLAPVERLAYGGSTLRRWARTFAGSADRRVLAASLVKGIAAGVRTRPRPAAEVLAGIAVKVPAGDQG